MADIFSSLQARKVFSLIALGGMAGAIFGPLVTKFLVTWIGVAPLLVVSAVALGLALVLLLRISAPTGSRAAMAKKLWVVRCGLVCVNCGRVRFYATWHC